MPEFTTPNPPTKKQNVIIDLTSHNDDAQLPQHSAQDNVFTIDDRINPYPQFQLPDVQNITNFSYGKVETQFNKIHNWSKYNKLTMEYINLPIPSIIEQFNILNEEFLINMSLKRSTKDSELITKFIVLIQGILARHHMDDITISTMFMNTHTSILQYFNDYMYYESQQESFFHDDKYRKTLLDLHQRFDDCLQYTDRLRDPSQSVSTASEARQTGLPLK